jgi:hypothetical protein
MCLTLGPMCQTAELPYLKGTTKATLCLALQLAGLAFPPTLKEQCISLEEQCDNYKEREQDGSGKNNLNIHIDYGRC